MGTSIYTLTESLDLIAAGEVRRRWSHRLGLVKPCGGWIVRDSYGRTIACTPHLGLPPGERGYEPVAKAWAAAVIFADQDPDAGPYIVEWERDNPPAWVGRRWIGFVCDPGRALELAEGHLAKIAATAGREGVDTLAE